MYCLRLVGPDLPTCPAERTAKKNLDNLGWRGMEDWRRDPESNRARRICNPLHNRFAIAPQAGNVQVRRSNKPTKKGSNASLFESGAGNEIRTRDLNLGKVALYQLSYSRIFQNTAVLV